jgi:hypothetical protein
MMRCGKFVFLRIFGCVSLLCLASAIAQAAGPKDLGTFKGWSALLLVEKKARICYLHGVPDKSSGKYKKRGDTYLQVTHRGRSKIRNEVSVTAGYRYKKGGRVTLDVDGRKFVLFTQGDTGWSGDKKSDNKLVAAMRAGRSMIVRGTSSRGTLTTDRYSLSGFTAAHKAISKACR